MENLELYNRFKAVPAEAKKTIQAGKLKGFTDINPMYRIKSLTEAFGPCGIGWYTEIIRCWQEPHGDEVCTFCEINLYIKDGAEWSKPIFGTGGSKTVQIFKGSPNVSDEGYKSAYTDALSVACKALGIGADVYWDKDAKTRENRTKYDQPVGDPDDVSKPVTKNHLKALAAAYKEVFGEELDQARYEAFSGFSYEDVNKLDIFSWKALMDKLDRIYKDKQS